LDGAVGAVEPLQAAALLQGSRDFKPSARIDPGIERQLEVFAARSEVAHPDCRVSGPQDEVVPAQSGGVRQIAEEIASAKLTGNRYALVQIARRIEDDVPNRRRRYRFSGGDRRRDDR